MRLNFSSILTCFGLLISGICGLDSASAQSFAYNLTNQTFSGFNLIQPSGTGFSGTLTAVSVNVTLNASVNNTRADDICIYVDYTPLSTGGIVQVGGNSSLSATERYFWPNGGSVAPGTLCIGTVNLTTPITFTGTFSDPVIWIGNGNSAVGTSGTWSGSITLTGVSAPSCVAPILSATTSATNCQGTSTGGINLSITGGSPVPLFISWSNGAGTEDLSNLSAGTYTVTVTTLGGGCSATGSYTVDNGPAPAVWYADNDGDGYGDPTNTQSTCVQPAGFITDNTDCNDGNNNVNPGMSADLCDGLDNDCDGSVDEDAAFLDYYVDGDSDAYGAGAATSSCSPINGSVTSAGDCDDSNTSVNPGMASDLCDGLDNDCDGSIDEDATFLDYYVDSDGDNFGAGAASSSCVAISGSVTTSGDCDDSNSSMNPGMASDLCDGLDNDCDGSIDEDAAFLDYYVDGDGDGFGTGAPTSSCATISGSVTKDGDCNDVDDSVNPGVVADLCNGVDNDCDGSIDEDDVFFDYYVDGDSDGYGAGAATSSCTPIAGSVTTDGDCNDGDDSVHPGVASDLCNGVDDDCDVSIDEDAAFQNYYVDGDGDGYGTGAPASSCAPISGSVNKYGDCNDGDDAVNPGVVADLCNGVDNDCDGSIDEDATFRNYYRDGDGDGYGAGATTPYCAPVSGWVNIDGDCDDANIGINPAAVEICNSIDDNCDGKTDDVPVPAIGAITGPFQQCIPIAAGSATFSVAPVAGVTNYVWTVPAGLVLVSGQGTSTIDVSWTSTAAHNGIMGMMTVTPGNGCGMGKVSSAMVDLHYGVPVRPSSISGASRLCPGDQVTYSVFPVVRATGYDWTLPSGMNIVSGSGTNIITVAVVQGYAGGTIECKAANVCGIGSGRTRSVVPALLTSPGSISGQASGLCGDVGVVYSISPVTGATGYNWTVPPGATLVSGQNTNQITVNFSGTYSSGNITVGASNSCGVGAIRNQSVTGFPAQPAAIIGDNSICPGQTGVNFSVPTVKGASTYQWAVPNGTTIVSGNGTKEIITNWGTVQTSGLTISVRASNSCGSSINRVLNGVSVFFIHCGSPRFADDSAGEGMTLFPNPATDHFELSFSSTEEQPYRLLILDATGKDVYAETGMAQHGLNKLMVNISDLSSGIYLVSCEINGQRQTTRLTK